MSQAILVLEDGRTFVGSRFGAEGERFGPLHVDTGMSGYQESLTDPDAAGRIVAFTTPHIGNTGWNDEDGRSPEIQAAGLVVRDPAPRPSNFRATRSLDDALVAEGIVGIRDVDTRALARHLRAHGSLQGAIIPGDDAQQALERLHAHLSEREDA